MADVELAKLGPAQLWYKGSELGKTFRGIRILIDENVAEIHYDQVGVTPWDIIHTGKTIAVEASLANLSHALLLAVMGSEAAIYTGGATPTCDQVLAIYIGVGISERDDGGELIVKPYIGGVVSTDPCQWFHIPLCYPRLTGAELMYDAETQRVLATRFQSLPVSQNNPLMAYMGCPELLPASIM